MALERDERRVLITHFGDAVKFVCANMFQWNGEKDQFGRSLLQYVGTEGVRSKYEHFWVDFIMQVLSCFPNQYDYVLIPDARFPNEITRTMEYFPDAIHLRVERPGHDSGLTPEQLSHISEIALDGWKPDEYIRNVGSLDDLRDTVFRFAESFLMQTQLTFDDILGGGCVDS